MPKSLNDLFSLFTSLSSSAICAATSFSTSSANTALSLRSLYFITSAFRRFVKSTPFILLTFLKSVITVRNSRSINFTFVLGCFSFWRRSIYSSLSTSKCFVLAFTCAISSTPSDCRASSIILLTRRFICEASGALPFVSL